MAPFLAAADIVVNCTLQDPNAPLTYLRTEDLAEFQPDSLIVDVSCDEGMGFSWARTTTFDEPMFRVGGHVNYYAVDHSPSYLWNSASWEISEACFPSWTLLWPGRKAGMPTRPSPVPLRSVKVLSAIRTSWSSRDAQRNTHTCQWHSFSQDSPHRMNRPPGCRGRFILVKPAAAPARSAAPDADRAGPL